MNPRRLHSETIFSISGFSFGSAISRAVFLNDGLMSREAHTGRRAGAHLDTTTRARNRGSRSADLLASRAPGRTGVRRVLAERRLNATVLFDRSTSKMHLPQSTPLGAACL